MVNPMRTCAICGYGVLHYLIRDDKVLCPKCARKRDDQVAEFIKQNSRTAEQPIRVMQPQCTCCPVHGRRG